MLSTLSIADVFKALVFNAIGKKVPAINCLAVQL